MTPLISTRSVPARRNWPANSRSGKVSQVWPVNRSKKAKLLMFFLPQSSTTRWMRATVSVALLICVVSITVLPQVDLPPTTLRGHRTASIKLIQFVVLTTAVAQLMTLLPHPEFVFLQERLFQSMPSRLSITCKLLC